MDPQKLVDILPLVPAAAAAATVPLSLVLLVLYRRAVLSRMLTPAGGDASGDDSDSDAMDHADRPTVVLPSASHLIYATRIPTEIVTVRTPLRLRPDAATLLGRMLDGPRHASAAYVWGGAAYALLFLTIAIFTERARGPAGMAGGEPPLRMAVLAACLFVALLWPTALSLPFVAGNRGRGWRFALPLALAAAQTGLLFLYAALGAAAAGKPAMAAVMARSQSRTFLLEFGLMTLLPALALLACGSRTLRSIAPLVLLALSVGLLGLPGAGAVTLGLAHLGVPMALGALAGLIVLAVALLLGWWTLRGVAELYDRKAVSDHQILIGVHFLTYCLTFAGMMVTGSESGREALLGGALLLPMVAYHAVLVWRFRSLRRAADEAPPLRLLLLRVFGPRGRSERLFEELAQHWRHVGSIQLIAGTDLAGSTAEPHTLFDFLGGRLAQRFVSEPGDLAARWGDRDLAPDPDGRFRVNEFFCHDDTWQSVLVRLVKDSDVVLMDLRGFSQKRQGCIYELHRLTDLMPLGRLLLLVDDTTDVPFLSRVLDEAWGQRPTDSPNAEGVRGVSLRLLHQEKGDSGHTTRQLLSMLSEAATEPDPRLGTQRARSVASKPLLLSD